LDKEETVSHFLVFYSRKNGEDPRVERIEDPAEAVQRLLEAESQFAGDPVHGVVMLVAKDEDDLRRTHSHYFSSVEELVRQAAG
jgi:hypothetical protein